MAKKEEAGEVAPPEDLMREHGVLKRVLLVYREGIRRVNARQDLPPDAIRDGAGIIRRFIEDYHEKLEEDYLFPRFEKADKLVDLTTVLRAQHQAGRRLTDRITQLLVQRVAEFHDVSLNAEVNLGSPVRQTPSVTKASRCRLLCRLDGSFTID